MSKQELVTLHFNILLATYYIEAKNGWKRYEMFVLANIIVNEVICNE